MKLLTVACITLLSLSGCGKNGDWNQKTAQQPSTEATAEPLVQVLAASDAKMSGPLRFHWRIINRCDRSVYVYSSLLNHPESAVVDIEGTRREITVQFLSLRKFNATPYYFPDTEFARIDPGQMLEGNFASKDALISLKTPPGSDNGSAAQKVRPGLWSIRSLIAYGDEVESVYRAMREQSERDYGHPIDPVVEWQRIASSHPVIIRLNSGN